MFLVGLTGGIGTGKSTVAQIFTELNVPVVDSDTIARKVVQPGRKAWKQIRQVFGDEILEPSGEINRPLLAAIIFSDIQRRQELNRITHPEIRKEIFWDVAYYLFRGYQFVVVDVPLLFESGFWAKYVHKIIVVTCEEDLQLQRLMDRNSLKESDAKARVASQMPLKDKCAQADFVIENSGNLEDTREQVIVVYKELRKSRTHLKFRAMVGFLGLCTGGILGVVIWLFRKWFLLGGRRLSIFKY
jgi:dephospho-CoA kinase